MSIIEGRNAEILQSIIDGTPYENPNPYPSRIEQLLMELKEVIEEGGGTSNYEQLTNKPSINDVTLTGNKTTSELGIVENAQADWSQTDSTADDYIKNKPTIPTVNDAVLTIQKNGTAVGTFSANAATAATINITVPVDADDVDALPDTTKYGASLALSIDSSTYVVTATLKDQDGNTLGTAQTIDLPLETVVVGGSYDDTTKKVILTLKNGNTIDFSVADLVAGLQTEITSTNKLDADLVDDTTSTHKFVTAADKAAWNAKSDFSGSYNDLTNKPTIPAAQVNADWNAVSGVAEILNKPTIPTVDQSYSASSTNAQSGTAVAQAVAAAGVAVTEIYSATLTTYSHNISPVPDYSLYDYILITIEWNSNGETRSFIYPVSELGTYKSFTGYVHTYSSYYLMSQFCYVRIGSQINEIKIQNMGGQTYAYDCTVKIYGIKI